MGSGAEWCREIPRAIGGGEDAIRDLTIREMSKESEHTFSLRRDGDRPRRRRLDIVGICQSEIMQDK